MKRAKTKGGAKGRGQDGMIMLEFVIALTISAALVGAVAVSARLIPLSIPAANLASASDSGETARRAMAADIAGAVRDSVRVTDSINRTKTLVEFVPAKGAGIFAKKEVAGSGTAACPSGPGGAPGDALTFGGGDGCFKAYGRRSMEAAAAGDYAIIPDGGPVALYAGGSASGAWKATIAEVQRGTADTRFAIASSTLATAPSDSVFQIGASAPVTWECDIAAGTLTRITGYGWSAEQPVEFSGSAQREVHATGMSSCDFALQSSGDWQRTILQTGLDGTGGSTAAIDASPRGMTLSMAGGASISTDSPKFGTGSLSLDGSGWLLASGGPSTGFGIDGYTAELHAFPSNVAGTQVLMSNRRGAGDGWQVKIVNGSLALDFAGCYPLTAGSIAAGRWTHVALTRIQGAVSLVVNGMVSSAGCSDVSSEPLETIHFGTSHASPGTSGFVGRIDDIRIVSGKSMYSTDAAGSSGRAFPSSPIEPFGPISNAFAGRFDIVSGESKVTIPVVAEPRNGRN